MSFPITILVASGLIIVIAVAIMAAKRSRRRKRWLRLWKETQQSLTDLLTASGAIMATHSSALVSQFRTKAYQDAYGNLVLDDWNREMDYFIERVVIPRLESQGFISRFQDLRIAYALTTGLEMGMGDAEANGFAGSIPDILRGWVHEEFQRIRNAHPSALAEVSTSAGEDRDGDEFEERCALLLTNAGWMVHRRGRSGDQGIDLVAKKEGLTVGIQCKNHKDPVGNACVQEAFTGATILGTHLAAVVSESGFTKSARVAATSTNVLLLTTEDLPCLIQRLPRQTK